MYLYKTQLTEAQIEAYEQPEGTRNPECGGGINCAFCALKMLDVYNKEFAEQGSNMCIPRYRLGDIIRTDEHITAIQGIIKDVYGEDHVFTIQHFAGTPNEILTKIASQLAPSEACYLVYGNSAPDKGTHAVVFRRADDGVLEMIDPQRGRKDEGTRYGITGRYAKELDDLGGRVDMTDNYYRVRGERAIAFAMQAQSVAFGYWATKEEFDAEFARNPAVFTIGTLLIDSMIKTAKMELDEHPPKPSPMKMDLDITGGGKNDLDKNTMYLTEGEEFTPQQASKFFKDSLQAMKEEEAADTEAETETEEAKEEPDVDPELFQTIVKLLGIPDGTDVITHLLELPEEEFEEEEEEEQTGGAAIMITPDDYKSQIQTYWASNQGADRVNSTFFLIKKALELYNVERTRNSKKGILSGFEYPNPTNQCKKVGRDAVGNICWLCGGFAPYKWETLKPESQMGMCKAIYNRRECEHILPINLMYFLKTLVNKEVPPTTAIQTKLRDMLYDNSCKLCNGKKDNGLYIRTQTIGGDIEPHVPNILSEVITFFTVYGGTTMPCKSGGGNMGTVPPELAGVGSLVHVKGKYYPNVIRAQLNPGFVYGTAPTIQATQAEKASKLSGPEQILSGIQTKYPEAYQKLTSEPDITKLTASSFGQEVLPHVTAILKGKLHTAASLEGPFKETARVDQKAAVDWVLRRFCIIYDRMKAICNVLNSEKGKELWDTQTQSLLSGTGQPIQQIKVLAVRNNGPESERIRIERMTKGSVAEESDEDQPIAPPLPLPPPAKRSRSEDDVEIVEETPTTKRRKIGGHIDISVHRGGRRVIEVDYV